MKIAILTGSARKNGNSEKLAAAFKAGAEAAGKTVTLFQTAHLKIGGCTGCEFCLKNAGECSLKDDMAAVLQALHQADAIVWASPVYYFSVTAQLKAAIDRSYPLVNDAGTKKTAMLLTCADESTDTAAGAIEMYNRIIQYYNWVDAGIIIATGVEHVSDIDGHATIKQAYGLGLKI